MRKATLLAASVLAVFAAGTAAAQSIHTGSDAGAYHGNFGPAILKVIGKEPSDEVKASGILPTGDGKVRPLFFEHKLATSEGTNENIERVKAQPTLDIGIGQYNEVAAVQEGLWIVDTGAKECLFGVTKNPNIKSTESLSPRASFGLPGKKSGSARTFLSVEPFASMRNIVHFDSTKDAVQAVIDGDVVAAGFVQLPDTTNNVFDQAKDLTFIGIGNRHMLRQTVNGKYIFEAATDIMVSPGSGWQVVGLGDEAKRVNTACTPVVVFGADPSLLSGYDKEDMIVLRDTLQEAADAGLLIPDTGDWRTMFADMAKKRESAFGGIESFLENQTK